MFTINSRPHVFHEWHNWQPKYGVNSKIRTATHRCLNLSFPCWQWLKHAIIIVIHRRGQAPRRRGMNQVEMGGASRLTTVLVGRWKAGEIGEVCAKKKKLFGEKLYNMHEYFPKVFYIRSRLLVVLRMQIGSLFALVWESISLNFQQF